MPSASHRALISTSGHNQCQTPQTWFESYNSLFSPIGCVNYAWCPTRVATLMQKQNSLTFHRPNSVFHWPKYCSFTIYLSPLVKNNSKKKYQLVKDLTTEKQGKSTTIQDKSGKCLTEENEILNRWTEYCSDLYNYETDGDPLVLDCLQIPDEVHHPILREEVEAAVKALKMGKTAGVDNIPAELVQGGGEAMIDILTTIYKIWRQENGQPHVITLPKKGARTTEPSALSAILLWS